MVKVRKALPYLRKTHGRIVANSSGAAMRGEAGLGAYGGSKAALNHLCATVAAEEAGVVTTVSVRPGLVDTDMQRELREMHGPTIAADTRARLEQAFAAGTLQPPERPARLMARLVLDAGADLSGKYLR